MFDNSLKEPIVSQEKANICQKTYRLKVGTAVFYFTTSFLITFVDKSILTTYHFPSITVVGLAHLLTAIVILYPIKKLNLLSFPDLRTETFNEIFPLPLIHTGGMLLSLGGAKQLSIPIAATLRRFAILMTMTAEYHILNIKPNPRVRASIFLLILGAVIAIDKPNFNLNGYVYILMSDILHAYGSVCTKEFLTRDTAMNMYGLHYYSSLFTFPLVFLIASYDGGLEMAYGFPKWRDPGFFSQFFLSSIMGTILSFSVMLCTLYNSALTTNIVACLKNALTTFLGMYFGNDYTFSWQTFIGISLSVIGSLHYTYVIFRPTRDLTREIVVTF